jgi:hypothetical protein
MLGALFSAEDSAHGDLGVIRDTYQIDHNKPHSMLLSLSIFNEILYQEMKKTSSPRIVILEIMECCQFVGSATREQSRKTSERRNDGSFDVFVEKGEGMQRSVLCQLLTREVHTVLV